MADLDNGEVVEAVDRNNEVTGVVYMLVPLEELWTVDIVVDRIAKLADDILEAAGIGFVEKLPQFLSQQNTLIS